MAKGRKDLALQIALILFVLLTIGVSVTSYIFYDKYRTEIDIRVAAVQATEAATKEANKAKEERDELKQLVGKGPAAGVTEIMGAFKRHQDAYGGTLPDEAARVYPTMLENQQDQIRKLQEDIISFQDAIKAQKTQFDQAIKQEQTKVAALQKDFTAQADEIRKIHEDFNEQDKNYKQIQESVAQQVDQKNQEVLAIREEAKQDQAGLKEQLRDKAREVVGLKEELRPYRNWETEPPDGTVVSLNHAAGTVFIDLGSNDGLRRQTSFSVVPHDVKNALNLDPKGALEVVRIVGPHLAEARITEDTLVNPIIPGDRIISPIFNAGRPERFAVAGTVDLNGDGQSDLEQLLALIRRNGGIVDAYVDENGLPVGLVTAATKFVIQGEPPDERSDPKLLDAYRKMREDADESAVGIMPLGDFLEYIGYRGRRGAGGRAETSGQNRPAGSPFRRRPGAGPAAGPGAN